MTVWVVETGRNDLDGAVIPELQLWTDDARRDGWRNMAVDEWLLRTTERPVLRIYRWEPDWGSYGYFVPDAEAAAALPGLKRVRRWTGGGIVDHRQDWTYTLVLPGREGLAGAKGAESYRVIHEALAGALAESGVGVRLSPAGEAARGGECFVHPVEYDLTDPEGRKIAGAGQRRTADGLLHQGSLACPVDGAFGEKLAARLADRVEVSGFLAEAAEIESIVEKRYGSESWRLRR
ncbi:lipoate-protein ligase A [Haloferula helveola]|uniref:Lipoate-protein ligase A n=1 Tax=Haloferula helveola TaxID=490095 RepID=A0ABM7R9R9_9BACT|nr:lipoate-protein ligase A [Haloferula helveola]